MTEILIALSLVILVACSAFFSSSETAFFSISKIALRQIILAKKKRAKLIETLKSNPHNLLTTILIGNNLVNNFSASLATALAVSLFGNSGVGIATLIMTIVIIIFGETVPKTLAAHHPIETAQVTAPYLRALEFILKPFVLFFSLFSVGINKLIKTFSSHHNPVITEDELKTLIELGSQDGILESQRKNMLANLFEFYDLRVRDIMLDRSLIEAVPDSVTYTEVIDLFLETGYSRLPVYSETIDEIIGILHYKDVLFQRIESKDFSIKECMMPALYIPDSKNAFSLVQTFRIEKQNMAVVINEHGSTAGLITIDDLLKEVFGRIEDEYDTNETNLEDCIEFLDNHSVRVPSEISLKDFNEIFNLELDSAYYRTLGGWFMEHLDALPQAQDSFEYQNILFTVDLVENRKIVSITMRM